MQKGSARVSREPQRAEEVQRLCLMQLHLNSDWGSASYIEQNCTNHNFFSLGTNRAAELTSGVQPS